MTQVKLDCQCANGRVLNEMRQQGHVVRRLQNPVIVQYIGAPKPTQVLRGPATDTKYEFGGKITMQCVDERDVEGILQRKRLGVAQFRVLDRTPSWQPSTPDEPAPPMVSAFPPAMDADPDPDDAVGDHEVADSNALDEDSAVSVLEQFNGIGEASAKKLVSAGYGAPQLANLSLDDTDALRAVAETSGVPLRTVQMAVEGAAQWAVGASE